MTSKAQEVISKFNEEEGGKVDVGEVIKDLINTEWSSDNNAQMKATQLLKGISLSEDPRSNKFMKAIDDFTSGLDPKDFE